VEIKDLLRELRAKGPGAIAREKTPFLIEEGRLHHDTRRVNLLTTRKVERAERAGDDDVASDMVSRRVYRLARRDGKPGDVSVGRAGDVADVAIELSSVSKLHASFKRAPEGWTVQDEGSTNGTFVDGDRLATRTPRPVITSSVLRFGPELRLTFLEADALERFLGQLDSVLAVGTAADTIVDEAVDVGRSKVLGKGQLPAFLEETDEDTVGTEPGAAWANVPTLKLTKGTRRFAQPAPAKPLAIECKPFPRIALVQGRPIAIGRIAGNDLVLPHPKVSRRHAVIDREGDEAFVIDLGSANGVHVDRKRVERATLRPGSRVTIEPFELTLVEAAAEAPVERAAGASIAILGQVSLKGVLEDVPLAEIVQSIEFNRKTGVLEVHGEGGTSGTISFRDGEPVAATCGNVAGEAAVLKLLATRKGEFVVRADDLRAQGEKKMKATFTRLLLESGRERDEASRGAGE
jgi:pSer/pThr/pTyr-binding forkhead associated (FHA) protein